MKPTWKGNKEVLLAQLIRLIEEFIASGKIQIYIRYITHGIGGEESFQ